MKKRLTRNCILMAIVTAVMAVVLSWYITTAGSVPAADNAATYTDGTYSATATREFEGYTSEVSVTVTIVGGKVSSVSVETGQDTTELGAGAAEQLAAALTAAGTSAGVDAVSGCTITSETVFDAFDACMEQAAQ